MCKRSQPIRIYIFVIVTEVSLEGGCGGLSAHPPTIIWFLMFELKEL